MVAKSLVSPLEPPTDAEGFCNQGALCKGLGRLGEAAASYRRALEIEPDCFPAHNNLGNVLLSLGRAGRAEACFRRALEIRPDCARAHYNLGNCLKDLGRPGAAETAYRRALEIEPDYALACINLGNALQELGRPGEAEAGYRHALTIEPHVAETHYNLGNALKALGRLPESASCYRRALELKPELAEAHYNLANALRDLGRPDEAEACYRAALHCKPRYPEAGCNLGQLLLAAGRYAEAWPHYESRYDANLEQRAVAPPNLPYPQWQGEPLSGKSLAIWPEQGFGDYVHFVRYAAALKERGLSRLTLVCLPPLKALLETAAGVDEVLTDPAAVSPHDYWSFPLSLPLRLGSTLDTVPASLPYLRPLPIRLARWRASLAKQGFKVGLVWKGAAVHQNDGDRSLPCLALLAPLWSVPGASFFSLQKGQGEEEARQAPKDRPIAHLGSQIKDFADTAAIVAQLDLVICVDTAVAHVAGALNKRCWLLLPHRHTDWRWLWEREDSPWYPGALRLFRQSAEGGWAEVIERVARALQETVG